MTEPTQADREAAASVESDWCENPHGANLITLGECDDWLIVQAFAAHREYGYNTGYYDGRTASTAALSKRVEELEAENARLRERLQFYDRAYTTIRGGDHA